jgi:hypothetical protein
MAMLLENIPLKLVSLGLAAGWAVRDLDGPRRWNRPSSHPANLRSGVIRSRPVTGWEDGRVLVR